MRAVISRVINDLLYRYDAFRDRRGSGRFRRANERIAVVLFMAALLSLGGLTAVTMTRPDGVTAHLPQLGEDSASPSSAASAEPIQIVTQTVQRNGKTVRLIRHRRSRGDAVLRTVAGRRTTVQASVTRREIVTVTDVEPVTVTGPLVTVTAPPVTITVVETVTCKKPPDCH
jgi:hypothetical protein